MQKRFTFNTTQLNIMLLSIFCIAQNAHKASKQKGSKHPEIELFAPQTYVYKTLSYFSTLFISLVAFVIISMVPLPSLT
jgi:hypothetical protein